MRMETTDIVASLSDLIYEARPAGLRRESFFVNGMRLDFLHQGDIGTDFVTTIFEPWELGGQDEPAETWSVAAWTCQRSVERVFQGLSGSQPGKVVKRWRGDFEHQAFLGETGAVVVLHREPFNGVTLYLQERKRIFCLFAGEPNVSHCEHTLKYPARTHSRRYGHIDCHASAVIVGGRAVLFVGRRQSGKTTCALDMVARGARYVSNDLCSVSIGSDGFLRVWALPHMLRLTQENAERLPKAALRAERDRGNIDYTRGMVFFGGKYELYAPLALDLIGTVVGKGPQPVGAVVFARGTTDRVPVEVQPLSENEAWRRFTKELCSDQPLPDWLPVRGNRLEAISHHMGKGKEIRAIRSVEFFFGFSDRFAMDSLVSAISP